MITLSEDIEVTTSQEEAFAFVADFSSVKEWDPQVTNAHRITAGPIRVGTKFDVAFRVGLKTLDLTYEITEFQPPKKLTLKGVGKNFRGEDRIFFSQRGDATAIRYEADLEFPGSSGLLSLPLKQLLKPTGRKAVQGLKRCLDRNSDRLEKLVSLESIADRLLIPGMLGFSEIGFLARKNHFPPIDTRLDGKTVIVTGASSGLGKAASLALGDLGASVGVVGRNENQLKHLACELEERTGRHDFDYFLADLSEPADVRSLAQKLKAKYSKIDVLIHNAGTLEREYNKNSNDLERSVAVNLVAPYILTTELFDQLRSAESSRIILVSSGGMYPVTFDAKGLTPDKRSFDGVKTYAMAKRSLVMLAEHWAKTFQSQGVVVHAMHPGWAKTPGVERSLPRFYQITKPILRSAEHGADTIVWLAAADRAGKCSGKFWHDRKSRNPYLVPGTHHSEKDTQNLLDFLAKQSDG